MRLIFSVLRHLIYYNKKNYFKISSIEKSKDSEFFLVTFFSLRQRNRLIVKTLKDILIDEVFINQFDPLDASKLGKIMAKSQYDKVFKAKRK